MVTRLVDIPVPVLSIQCATGQAVGQVVFRQQPGTFSVMTTWWAVDHSTGTLSPGRICDCGVAAMSVGSWRLLGTTWPYSVPELTGKVFAWLM